MSGPAINFAGEVLDEVERAWLERKSIRAFRPEPLPREALERILGAAQRAPSWCNVQPWRVVVTQPPMTGQLAAALQTAAKTGLRHAEVPFPRDYPSPYKAQRIKCGGALCTPMGIAPEDKGELCEAWRGTDA